MKTHLFLFAIFVIAGKAFSLSTEKKDEYGVEWCIEHKASLDTEQLRCLHSLDEVQIVKDGFADIVRRQRTCPKCKAVIIDEDKYLPFSQFPFLITQEEVFTRSGCTVVHIVFKEGPLQEAEACLVMNNKKKVEEFILFETPPTSKKMIGLIKKLRGKKFERFWIPTLTNR